LATSGRGTSIFVSTGEKMEKKVFFLKTVLISFKI
jgi:hypothetical protein